MLNAALKKQIRCKICVHCVNRKIFLEVHPLCTPPGNLDLKTPVLIGLITKWQIEIKTVKTRLAVEN